MSELQIFAGVDFNGTGIPADHIQENVRTDFRGLLEDSSLEECSVDVLDGLTIAALKFLFHQCQILAAGLVIFQSGGHILQVLHAHVSDEVRDLVLHVLFEPLAVHIQLGCASVKISDALGGEVASVLHILAAVDGVVSGSGIKVPKFFADERLVVALLVGLDLVEGPVEGLEGVDVINDGLVGAHQEDVGAPDLIEKDIVGSTEASAVDGGGEIFEEGHYEYIISGADPNTYAVVCRIIICMKSKQSVFEDIVTSSIRKAREKTQAGSRDEFELRMKALPTKIKELDADPYMFVFDSLIEHKDCADYVFSMYLVLIEENFLSPTRNAEMLAKHFRQHMQQHSFKIIEILMKIKQPNLTLFQLFFELHSNFAMAESVLDNFKYTGYRWLARAFSFKKLPKPTYVEEITTGILKSQNRNLPTTEDQQHVLSKYVEKIVHNMTLKIDSDMSSQPKSKYGFCLMCSKPADYYCKDTKIPVCGSECKKAHLNYISNNPSIDYQYSDSFRQQIQSLLITNIIKKKNMALSIDYLCAIFINSLYIPVLSLPHKELLLSPVIAERVWVLYIMHHLRKGEVFEHIFADCLSSDLEYVRMNSVNYFMKMVQAPRILQIYESLDEKGLRRLVPIILSKLPDPPTKVKFCHSLINIIYNSTKSSNSIVQGMEGIEQLNSTLLRAINHEKDPLKIFKQHFDNPAQKMAQFIIKNEQQVNRTRIGDIIMQNEELCRAFLKELLIEEETQSTIRIKGSELIDQILREIFFFVNVKVSDKIYRLMEILHEVLPLNKLDTSREDSLGRIFSDENISSNDTFFTFCYFILMIVTELHRKDDGKTPFPTQDDFMVRISHFDKKLVLNQQGYLLGVYRRLVDTPFSQQTRGFLTYYPAVPYICTPTFRPASILLDNWEGIYEVIMEANNQTSFLYQCCSLLVSYPQICQPFFQMLLNKLNDPVREQHLIPSIAGILQEEPNCIGAAWKLVFSRNPLNNSFLFDLSGLVHYSKSLTTPNFIWFVRNFCNHVTLAYNHKDCLKLLSYNLSIAQNSPQRIQIIDKELPNVYASEYNVYYQLLFLKGVFALSHIPLAVTLLNLTPLNIVTEPLFAIAINDIILTSWASINEQQVRMSSGTRLQKKPWTHLINIMCTLSMNNPALMQSFSNTLKSIPECYCYFEQFNILQCIKVSNNKITTCIHPELTVRLHSLQEHIPQMDSFLLSQFIKIENVQAIAANFKYFWKMGDAYILLRDYLIAKRHLTEPIDLANITDVLSHAHYVKEITNDESQISRIVGFALAAAVFLDQAEEANKIYHKIVTQMLHNIALATLKRLAKPRQDEAKGSLSKPKAFICMGKILFYYLESLALILAVQPPSDRVNNLLTGLPEIRRLLHAFNEDYQTRIILKTSLNDSKPTEEGDSEEEGDSKWEKPPGLLLHEQLISVLLCCNCGNKDALLEILTQNLPVFSRFLGLKSTQIELKNRKKVSGKMKKEQVDPQSQQQTTQNWDLKLTQKAIDYFHQTLTQIGEWGAKNQLVAPSEVGAVQRILFEYLHLGFDLYSPAEGSFKTGVQEGPIYRLHAQLSKR